MNYLGNTIIANIENKFVNIDWVNAVGIARYDLNCSFVPDIVNVHAFISVNGIVDIRSNVLNGGTLVVVDSSVSPMRASYTNTGRKSINGTFDVTALNLDGSYMADGDIVLCFEFIRYNNN